MIERKGFFWKAFICICHVLHKWIAGERDANVVIKPNFKWIELVVACYIVHCTSARVRIVDFQLFEHTSSNEQWGKSKRYHPNVICSLVHIKWSEILNENEILMQFYWAFLAFRPPFIWWFMSHDPWISSNLLSTPEQHAIKFLNSIFPRRSSWRWSSIRFVMVKCLRSFELCYSFQWTANITGGLNKFTGNNI